MKTIGISQRYTYLEDRCELRTTLDTSFDYLFNSLSISYKILPYSEHIESHLTNLDGIILSGGNDISKYVPTLENKVRDEQETRILDYAIAHNIPVLGICRGMLFINTYFGGTIEKINMETCSHVAVNHKLTSGKTVNSYHNWKVIIIGDNIKVRDTTEVDGCIEEIESTQYAIKGIMWHPERALLHKSNLSSHWEKKPSINIHDIILIREFFHL